MKYIQPEVYSKSFTCPHCGTIAMQNWWHKRWNGGEHANSDHNPIRVGICQHCDKTTVWIIDKMYYPAMDIPVMLTPCSGILTP